MSIAGKLTCGFIKFIGSSNCGLNNTKNFVSRGYVVSLFHKNNVNIRCYSQNVDDKDTQVQKIYYGLLTPQIKAVKIISFTTSIGGLVAQPILIKQASAMEGGLPIILSLCGVVGFFTFVTPFLLHIVTKKYITHLDYNPKTDKYIATIITFFCRQKKIIFSAEDVIVPDVPGMFTTFKVKGIPLFVDPNLFTDASHYGKLMGYHKPMDYKLMDVKSVKKS